MPANQLTGEPPRCFACRTAKRLCYKGIEDEHRNCCLLRCDLLRSPCHACKHGESQRDHPGHIVCAKTASPSNSTASSSSSRIHGVFLFGYIMVLLAFAFEIPLVSQLFVCAIFLLGSIFVSMGIVIRSRLSFEIQPTLKGLLSIGAQCKKSETRTAMKRTPVPGKASRSESRRNQMSTFRMGSVRIATNMKWE